MMVTYRGILNRVVSKHGKNFLTLVYHDRMGDVKRVVHDLYSEDEAFTPERLQNHIGWMVYGTASEDGDIQTYNVEGW